MNKTEYIVKVLSRTNRKDYENYVINRIWHQLNDLDIKPVSQQYVKRKDGGYALIDLYFPQFNLGIECDEFRHAGKNALSQDELRHDDILFAIKDYKERRVPIYKKQGSSNILILREIEEINKDIDKIVNEIKELKKESQRNGSFKAWTGAKDVNSAKEKGFMDVRDAYYFRTNSEIRDFLGLSNVNIQRSFYKIDANYYLWLPHMAIEQLNGVYTAGSWAGHINLLSEDGQTIYEWVNYKKKISKRQINQETESKESFNRIVFAKARDNLDISSYRFLGIFNKTGETIEKTINGKNLTFRVYRLQNKILKRSQIFDR